MVSRFALLEPGGEGSQPCPAKNESVLHGLKDVSGWEGGLKVSEPQIERVAANYFEAAPALRWSPHF